MSESDSLSQQPTESLPAHGHLHVGKLNFFFDFRPKGAKNLGEVWAAAVETLLKVTRLINCGFVDPNQTQEINKFRTWARWFFGIIISRLMCLCYLFLIYCVKFISQESYPSVYFNVALLRQLNQVPWKSKVFLCMQAGCFWIFINITSSLEANHGPVYTRVMWKLEAWIAYKLCKAFSEGMDVI